ncbi:MAG TPA: hypothetical protein PLM07_03070 [Candidatus Rifleibacterium sp.]|nr:hypothetical protein [Candidatus Rifleibacterium sp.]HPT44867.1 hypothetical protein [Candidatus Rifleibacterium sp.]
MNRARRIWPAVGIFLSMVLLPALLLAGDTIDSYAVTHLQNKLSISFAREYAFDEIELPAVSNTLWGTGNECRAVLLELNGRQFVSSVAAPGQTLIFRPGGLPGREFFITPLIVNKGGEASTGSEKIRFSAVPAEVRSIETRITELTDRVSAFQQENRCFSCHTALPLALVFREAGKRRMAIDPNSILNIGREISAMQLGDGSFFFAKQPVYGRITTTLCAGAVIAIISDFSTEFMINLKRILPLLVEWNIGDEPLQADFFLRPLFSGQPATALFESLIISTMYCKSENEGEVSADERLQKRLMNLQKWVTEQNSEPLLHRMITMLGMPVLVQVSHSAREAFGAELVRILEDEPEGRRRDVRAIAFSILSRLGHGAPAKPRQQPERPQTLADELWECLEQIIQAESRPAKKPAVFRKE